MKGRGLMIVILIVILSVYYTHSVSEASMSIYHLTPSLRISVQEARFKRFGLIIDVRTPTERANLGFYPNSIPISLHHLQTEVPLDISNKNIPILIYSNGDSRAETAASIVYRMGYQNVRYITELYTSLLPGSR